MFDGMAWRGAVWVHPAYCPNRHPQVSGRVLVGYQHCGCGDGTGHMTAQCLACGAKHFDPPHDPTRPAYRVYGGAGDDHGGSGERVAWTHPPGR